MLHRLTLSNIKWPPKLRLVYHRGETVGEIDSIHLDSTNGVIGTLTMRSDTALSTQLTSLGTDLSLYVGGEYREGINE